jgi:hypothetical protein
VIADVRSQFERSRKVMFDEAFRRFCGRSRDHVNAPLGEQPKGVLAHTACNDDRDTPLRQPRRQEPRLMRRCVDVLASQNRLCFRINVNQGKPFAMAEMVRQLATCEGNDDSHGLLLLVLRYFLVPILFVFFEHCNQFH